MTKHVLHMPDFTPVSLNVLMRGVRQRIRAKRGDRDLIALEATLQQIPKATVCRRVSLFITIARGQRVLDEDNCWKSILDALVCAGLLVNDSPVWVKRGDVHWARAVHGCQRTTFIVLEDM